MQLWKIAKEPKAQSKKDDHIVETKTKLIALLFFHCFVEVKRRHSLYHNNGSKTRLFDYMKWNHLALIKIKKI